MTQPPNGNPRYQFPESTIKSSERLFDLLKGEQDRLQNKIRTAEDRARGNNTAALAIIGVVTMLNTLKNPPPLPLVVLLVTGVILTLALGLSVLRNRDTRSIAPEWMEEELQRLKTVERHYLQIMQLYQRGWIRNIKELTRLQDEKYSLLDWQNYLLAVTLLVGVVLLAVTPLGIP